MAWPTIGLAPLQILRRTAARNRSIARRCRKGWMITHVDDLDDLDGRGYHPTTFDLLDCAVERSY